jgi:DNA-binding response OmpR family regulator
VTGVLVVDDDQHLLKALRITLQAHGYTVETAADGEAALIAASRNPPAIVVLDLGLPDMDGAAVLRELRRWSTAPVLVLSARHGSSDKVDALDAGADDYITKPFGLDEVAARIGAVLRRTRVQRPSDPTLRVADLTLNTRTREVKRDGAVVDLSPTEFRLLRYLMLRQGQVVTRARLLEHVWSYDFNGDDTVVATYISYLRRKIDGQGERLIRTHRGVGYSLRGPLC